MNPPGPDIEIDYKDIHVKADMDPIEWLILFFIIAVVVYYITQ